MVRQWLSAAVAVGALFALTAAWQHGVRGRTAAPGAAQAQAAEPADTFRLVWAQPAPNLRNTSLASDGQSVVTVSSVGRIQLWNWAQRPTHPLWSHLIPGASQAVVGAAGKVVLAYARLDPTRPVLYVLGAGGKLIGRSTVDGPIWDVALSPDGSHAAVTTGPTVADANNHSLYLYTLGVHPTRRWQHLGGIGNSVALCPGASRLAVGTWDTSGVTCYTGRGATLWQYAPPSHAALADRLFNTQMTQDGQAVLGLSYANVHDGDGTLYLWRGGAGRLAWTHPLGENAFSPQAQISENGQCVAVTYTRLVTHGEVSVSERRLAVLDANGNTLWEKGGLLFSPTLVSVAADGQRVTVSDGHHTLYHLDASGRITAPYVFHARILKTSGTADGRWLLVSTGDGLLNLLRLD